MARRSGLGKGLGALIPPDSAGSSAGTAYREVPVASVRPNARQPRRHFDEEALAALTTSVRELGVLQPVLVREAGEGYELIAGERRWRAAKRAGLPTLPVLVRDADDLASLEQALVENLHRADLNPLEEAAAYAQLLEDFSLTHEALARRVGKSRVSITNTLRLFQLPPGIQRAVADGRLSAGHARALLGTPDRTLQERLAERVVDEQLSVRAVEEAVRTHASASRTPEDGSPVEPPPGAPPVEPPSSRERAGRPRVDPDQALIGDDIAPIGPAGSDRPAGLVELEELLSEHLSTRVRIEDGSHPRVVIDYADLDDLERIYRQMAGSAPG